MVDHKAEYAVTLSAELYARLVEEANRLNVPLEWVVAGLIADTMDPEPVAA